MFKTLPIFTSHYSIGCSILTLDNPKDSDRLISSNGPQSIIKICVDNKISQLFLIESSLSGFVKALKSAQDNSLKLHFGLKIVVCSDLKKKDTDSLSSEYKIIVFAKNDDGYRTLKKIYTAAATEGFYYRPRIDSKTLKSFWNKNLLLVHPFYYSFLHRNLLYLANCNPELDFAKNQFFFVEDNDLPFNYLIKEALGKYSEPKIPVKTIYYSNKEDFKAFVTNKAIHNRRTLSSPNQEHLASNEFDFGSWATINI